MEKQKNKKAVYFIGGLILAVIIFYAGNLYGKRQSPASNAQGFSQNGFGNRARNMGGNGGFAGGEILAKDDKSITLKTQNGGSRIVFYNGKTGITKSVDGILSDLVVGQTVSINGTANPDGSITAQTIQIRPNLQGPRQN